jgi:hypothetical protein
MRIYTVHLRHQGLDPDRDVVVVKEGFSWPAFLFSVAWACWHRLWLVALVLLVGEAAVNAAAMALGLDPISLTATSLGFALVVGHVGNDLRRWTLGRKGFLVASVVGGSNADAAMRRFLDHNPRIAIGALR